MTNARPSASIGFVGAGPTTLYTLCAFLNEARHPASITIYEEQPRAGLGTPYRPGWNDPAMLSNIASIEIPKIEETLLDWLERQSRARLVRLGIDPDQIDDRSFYPRVALGEYFLDQFKALVSRARSQGVDVEIATSRKVTDIRAEPAGLRLVVTAQDGSVEERVHDQLVLATGHRWPEEPEVRPGFYASPWPASALQRIPATRIGIRGSSLTAIDAAVAVAVAHGNFIESEGTCVDYQVHPGSEALKLVMMSRKGLLPEADFFHPVPYLPLETCTESAITGLIAKASPSLLDDAYGLFKQELAAADPDYADHVGLVKLTLEDFADAYFADRIAADAFDWAQANLEEARRNFADRMTVPWRYAILRMHEVIALIAPHLDEDALDRFNRYWKPVFVDDYATVPHLSIERLLALHRAGHLAVQALGEAYRIDTRGEQPGAIVTIDGQANAFPIFIDATGQRPLPISAFPFETLVAQGVVQDAAAGDPPASASPENKSEGASPPKGIAVDALFHPASEHPAAERLFCLGIPFLLGRHPFIQGITSSHEIGQIVGTALAAAIEAGAGEPTSEQDEVMAS